MTLRKAALPRVLGLARVAVLAVPLACGSAETHGTRGALPRGVVARVGDDTIALDAVSRIAVVARVSREDALQRAVEDALLAQEAVKRYGGSGGLALLRRAAAARALADDIYARATKQGPPRREEIEELARQRWADFSRPESVRTVHAVVLVKNDTDRGAARALALRIAQAVAGARDADEFARRARDVPAGGLEVVIERLPPCTADGRVVPESSHGGGQFDVDFARAANDLESVGDQSPPVETRFGFHVIQLIERIPEKRTGFAERERELTPVVMRRRAKQRLDALLERLHAVQRIAVERSAEQALARLAEQPLLRDEQ